MIIIGAGRVGTALRSRAAERHRPCHLIDRDDGWEALDARPGFPILVAVRNDDLVSVVKRVPAHRREDLVFAQNGMIRPWLLERGLGQCTRGVLYFAVPARGAPITPGGPSPFCGHHAGEMVGWFIDIGLEAANVSWPRFSRFELEKLIWNAAFGVLCETLDAEVGKVCTHHGTELRSLTRELSQVGRAALGVDIPHDFLQRRLCGYAQTIPTYRASVNEWEWRNGWFVATAKRYRISTPLHIHLLEGLGKL